MIELTREAMMERMAITAWLRDYKHQNLELVVDAIDAGAHHKPAPVDRPKAATASRLSRLAGGEVFGYTDSEFCFYACVRKVTIRIAWTESAHGWIAFCDGLWFNAKDTPEAALLLCMASCPALLNAVLE